MNTKNGMARKRRAFQDITHTPNIPETPRLIYVTKKPRSPGFDETPQVVETADSPGDDFFILDESSGEFIRPPFNGHSFKPCAISTPLVSNTTDENTPSLHCAVPSTPRLIHVVKKRRQIPQTEETPSQSKDLFSQSQSKDLVALSQSEDLYLDEMSGDFRKSEPFLSCVSPDDTCAIIDRVLELEELVAKQQEELNKRQETLQQTEREILDSIIAKQDEKLSQMSEEISELQELVKSQAKELFDVSNGKFGKRMESMKKAEKEYIQKVKILEKPLSPIQIEALTRDSTRGIHWGIREIRDGLILKMKSGTSGYDSLVNYLPILPAVRTLQRNLQHVLFAPGMLHSVFDMLEVLGKVMPNIERDCQLVLDEMQLEATPKYDSALKNKIGYATLPTHEGTANKALPFILAGIATGWKLSVRVEFTNRKEQMYQRDRSNPTGCAYKNIIDELLVKAESVGLRVSNVTSDMGPDNLAFWRAYGVKANRNQVTSSFKNPVRPDAKVYLLPDVVHMMKNTKAMLESNGTVELPSDVVEELGLCSPTVDYKHIEELYEYEKDNELKVAFRLKESTVHTKKHFKKMNVGTAKSVICHRTGVGLKILAREKDDPSYETTAWFIMYLNTFFALATARHRGLAISKANMGAYERAIHLIQRVSYIFANMKVGQAGVWKPVQRGMVILCHGYLQLIDYFLNDQKYAYLMLGRFTSDCIENIFSLIRLKQAVPNASLFLQNLKVITLAQYSSYVKGSSYDCDGSSAVSNVDFLQEARERALVRANQRFAESLEELMTIPIDQVTEADFGMFDYLEKSVLYDIAGSQIAKIKTSNAVICDVCLSAVLWKGDNPHPDALVTVVKEYDNTLREDTSEFLQICVSDQVFKAILSTEVTFRKYRDRALKLKSLDMKQYFVENLMSYVWNGAEIPNCHEMSRKILNSYMDFRVEKYFKKLRQKIKETETIERSSKSVAGRQAASQMV